MSLVICHACSRHIRRSDGTRCHFCGARLVMPPPLPRITRRSRRAILVATAALGVACGARTGLDTGSSDHPTLRSRKTPPQTETHSHFRLSTRRKTYRFPHSTRQSTMSFIHHHRRTEACRRLPTKTISSLPLRHGGVRERAGVLDERSNVVDAECVRREVAVVGPDDVLRSHSCGRSFDGGVVRRD